MWLLLLFDWIATDQHAWSNTTGWVLAMIIVAVCLLKGQEY